MGSGTGSTCSRAGSIQRGGAAMQRYGEELSTPLAHPPRCLQPGQAGYWDTPAYRQAGLPCAPSPREGEMGGGGSEPLSDKGVLHFLSGNDSGLKALRPLTQSCGVLPRALCIPAV